MALFKRQPTASEKRDVNAIISRAQTCARNINESDNIAVFFREWEKITIHYHSLLTYEKSGYPFSPSPSKLFERDVFSKKQKVELKCINRAFDRLQAGLISLKTTQGKIDRINSFFDEMEYYSDKMEPENIEYLKTLKESMLKDYPVMKSKAPSASFCPNCGNRVGSGDLFCSNCGRRLPR